MRNIFVIASLALIALGLSVLFTAAPQQGGSVDMKISAPQDEAAATVNPCAKLPRVCRYTWDPVEKCCVADPRFDCVDICY